MSSKSLIAVAMLALLCCSKTRENRRDDDSASFAQLQQRGEVAMGVNQYTSQHVFEPLADGGRIVLQRRERDSVGEAAIRAHMRSISASFSKGDFAVPGFVHDTGAVPGTAVMQRLKAEISYTPRDLPNGAEVVISTRNREAVSAIHEFLAFQRMDHHAGMHAGDPPPSR